jgi:hypothetical protein
MLWSTEFPPTRRILGPSRWKRPIRSLLEPEKSDSHRDDFSYERPAKPGSIEPELTAERVTAAKEIGPSGIGCGFMTTFGKAAAAAGVSREAQPDRSAAAERAAAPPRK